MTCYGNQPFVENLRTLMSGHIYELKENTLIEVE